MQWKIKLNKKFKDGVRDMKSWKVIIVKINYFLAQKGIIEKESTNLLKNMENNHLKAVEELETLYEKKLTFENEKFLQ